VTAIPQSSSSSMATSAVATLVKFNRLHESQYASDKLIKTVGFAAGFISSLLSRGMCGVCVCV
jgi:hypothetical protein